MGAKLAVAGSVVAGLLAVGGVGVVSAYQPGPGRSVQLVQPAADVAPVAPVVAPVAPVAAPVEAAPVAAAPVAVAPAVVAPVEAAPARVTSPQAVAPVAAPKQEVAPVAVQPVVKPAVKAAAVVADPAPAVVDPAPAVVPDPVRTYSDGTLVEAGKYPDGSPARYTADGLTVIPFPENCANKDGSITKADWSSGLPVCVK